MLQRLSNFKVLAIISMIKEIVTSKYPVSNTSLKKIEELVQIQEFEKGINFIEKDKRNRSEYFLLEGVCKSYLLNPEGEEITISFFNSKSVLSPWKTRTAGDTSFLNFQALTNIKLGVMNAISFRDLMIDDNEVGQFGYSVLARELESKVRKEVGLASKTARERLIEFRLSSPNLENEISHKDIATYLGITNISLSRLRRELIV